ncbi:hypothetical protein SprV_0301176300 [Sparganum proliferum]
MDHCLRIYELRLRLQTLQKTRGTQQFPDVVEGRPATFPFFAPILRLSPPPLPPSLHSPLLSYATDRQGHAGRQHKNWFDDNDAVISNLLGMKNRQHKAYFNRPTDDNKAAFYLNCCLVPQQLSEMQDVWTVRKAQGIQWYADRNKRKNSFAAIKVVYGPTAKGTAHLLSANGTTLLTEMT